MEVFKMSEIRLGSKVADVVTGYKGTVTAKTEYLHEQTKVLVEGVDKNGKPVKQWFVEARVALSN